MNDPRGKCHSAASCRLSQLSGKLGGVVSRYRRGNPRKSPACIFLICQTTGTTARRHFTNSEVIRFMTFGASGRHYYCGARKRVSKISWCYYLFHFAPALLAVGTLVFIELLCYDYVWRYVAQTYDRLTHPINVYLCKRLVYSDYTHVMFPITYSLLFHYWYIYDTMSSNFSVV